MTHDALEEAVPLYATGALERLERQALETHLLSGCVSCHTALKEYQAVAALLPFGLPSTPPPDTLKEKIMAAGSSPAMTEDAADAHSPKPSLKPGEWMNHLFPPKSSASAWSLRWGLSIVTLGILATSTYLAWHSYTAMTTGAAKLHALETASQEQATMLASVQDQLRERERTIDRLKEEVRQHRTEATELMEQLTQRETELEEIQLQLITRGGASQAVHAPEIELAALLRQTNGHAISLAGSDMAKRATGFLLYNARARTVWLYALNLPTCPEGMNYQLWAMQDTPVHMGTFHNHDGETAHRFVNRLQNISAITQFAISLEPMGERPAPTGPIYLASQS